MKRIINFLVLILVISIIVIGYQCFHIDNRYFAKQLLYTEYQGETDYQSAYPVSDYVDEQMNAIAIFRSGLLGSMVNYDTFVSQESSVNSKIKAFGSILLDHNFYTKNTQQNQYIESTPISLTYVGEQETHNYEYSGQLSDGTTVTGNVAIWGEIDNVNVAISFQNDSGGIDQAKASLLADDSNSEMLAYLIIEELQTMLATNYSPDQASEMFFGCDLEKLAGSITYHATTSLLSLQSDVGEVAVARSKTVNLSTYDDDGYLVNRSF